MPKASPSSPTASDGGYLCCPRVFVIFHDQSCIPELCGPCLCAPADVHRRRPIGGAGAGGVRRRPVRRSGRARRGAQDLRELCAGGSITGDTGALLRQGGGEGGPVPTGRGAGERGGTARSGKSGGAHPTGPHHGPVRPGHRLPAGGHRGICHESARVRRRGATAGPGQGGRSSEHGDLARGNRQRRGRHGGVPLRRHGEEGPRTLRPHPRADARRQGGVRRIRLRIVADGRGTEPGGGARSARSRPQETLQGRRRPALSRTGGGAAGRPSVSRAARSLSEWGDQPVAPTGSASA